MWFVAAAFALAVAALPPLRWWLRRTDRASGRRILLATSAVHLTNDACFAIVYPLLPLIAADFGLSYAQVGLVKTAFSGSSSALQFPAGLLAERLGEYLLLIVGNLWVGVGLGAMAASPSYAILLAAALLAGIGGNAQHPLAPSLVARAFDKGRLATAIGTLNFSGDLGKLVGPLVVGLAAPLVGWQGVLGAVGAFTAALSAGLLWRRREVADDAVERARDAVDEAAAAGGPDDAAAGNRFGFWAVTVAGGLDDATRSVALTFLPFWFARQGLDAAAISLLLGVILAGGATGKFVCGWLSDKIGTLATIVVTEVVTAGALLLFLVAPPIALAPLSVVFGFALNGTSSALYTTVARLAPAGRRARAYGIFFTTALFSASVAPLLYGAIGDAAGLVTAFVALAGSTVLVVPVVVPIRAALAER